MNNSIPTPGEPFTFAVWPGGAPGSETWSETESETVLPNGIRVVRNVAQPTLTAYLPDPAIATGTAVIVCPGGAYHFLAAWHEGLEVAQRLNARGIAAFVLKYRVLQTGEDFPECVERNLQDPQIMAERIAPIYALMLADGCEALRLVRARAAEWGILAQHVGIMGFSAGGMLTSMVARQYAPDCRPDFAAPIYTAPPPAAPIPADAPPLFLLCADDDLMASNASIDLYREWKQAGRPVELHIYAGGGHGFGMNPQGLPADRWIERFEDWVEATIH